MEVLVGLCFAVTILYTQEFRATLTGRISDATGSAIANGKITATHTETNESAEATTGSNGDYNIPLLKPGPYSVKVEATGFKAAVRNRVDLFVGDQRTVDFTMEVGFVQESVTVTAAAPMLDEATATQAALSRISESRSCLSTAGIHLCWRPSLRAYSSTAIRNSSGLSITEIMELLG